MAADAKTVMELRDRTGAGVMDCKAALQASDGDLDAAVEFLRKKGLADAKKREGRDAKDGLVHAYIHAGAKLGALVEINCETDFVAKTDAFQNLVRDLAMQVAATNPSYVSREDVPATVLEKEREIYRGQMADQKKPAQVIDKIVEGKLEKFFSENCLLEQAFVKDGTGKTKVKDLVDQVNASTKEKIVLKLSGEALAGSQGYGLDPSVLVRIGAEVRDVTKLGVQIAIVIGGGNIFRGVAASAGGMERATADYMGMLATIINALALQDALESAGQQTRVQTAITMSQVAEPYIRRKAIRHLEKGRVVIFAAGTGNPFFTTDTAAALRALEIHAEAILMAKNGVEGVYDADPSKVPDANFLPEITHMEAIERGLRVMDSTALSLCMDNHLPINVFNMNDESNIDRIVSGERVGTLVTT